MITEIEDVNLSVCCANYIHIHGNVYTACIYAPKNFDCKKFTLKADYDLITKQKSNPVTL